MNYQFPTPEWLDSFSVKLNSDARYAQLAKKWEADLVFDIEPSGPLKERIYYYMDLWHGTCRKAEVLKDLSSVKPAFILKAPYENFARILKGELDALQAMMTRKLIVQGSMAYMMRNVPVVLDFVRCAREVTSEVLS